MYSMTKITFKTKLIQTVLLITVATIWNSNGQDKQLSVRKSKTYSQQLAVNPIPPFDCLSGLGYIFTNTAGNQVTSLWSFNLASDARTLIKSPLVAAAPNQFINAVGYNTLDSYLYGNRVGTNQIVKIGSNGDIEYLHIQEYLPLMRLREM